MIRSIRFDALVRFPAWGATVALVAALFLVGGPAKAEQPEAGQAQESSDGTVTKTLKWATASEVDNFGYDVYRGESSEGPFERRTEEPVLGAGTTDEPSYYEWVDEGLDPTKDYFYYVESISIHDERERFTPIIEVKAKIPSDTEADAETDTASDDEGGDG